MSETQNFGWPGWEIVRLIGRGSFGAVYEIQRRTFDTVEKAALKVISIPQNSSEIEEMYSDGYDAESITCTFRNHLESVVAEYTLMRKMNGSANIVNSEDIRYTQHEDGIGWDILIKMELLTPITKLFASGIPEKAVIRLAKDMCKALELCKKHGIVHRDIKPQNIFVSEHGDYKLGDFGIAKTIEGTMGGTKIGTYKYMAPEVYNNQPYGSSADIYSLGLVLYWLLNERRMPFMPLPPEKLTAGMDERSRQRRMAGEVIPAPAHGSNELKRIVLQACAFDPRKRYASAAAMLADLSQLDDGSPVSAAFAFCGNCGHKQSADTGFCASCGTPMHDLPSVRLSKPAPKRTNDLLVVEPKEDSPVQPSLEQKKVIVGHVEQPACRMPANQAPARVETYREPVQAQVKPVVREPEQVFAQTPAQQYDGQVHNGRVGFGKAIGLFFKNYANFKGRASRSEYWLASLFSWVLYIPIFALLGPALPLGIVLLIALAIPNLSLSFRRLHDVGKSGGFIFMGLIPFAGAIILLVQFFRGSDSSNRWGPGPRV